MIVFSNPGEIDIRAVTILGVNVKPLPGAIGYFGTGLKYAIAVLLREGCRVEIWSGGKCYKFGLQEEVIRGKSFQRIIMSSTHEGKKELSITLEFGKNWTLEGAYRELWSNCMDEQGVVFEDRSAALAAFGAPDESSISAIVTPDGRGRFHPSEGITSICIHGEAFAQVHDARYGKVLLPKEGKLLFENSDIQIFHGASQNLYYKGIKVWEQKRTFLFTYNLLGQRTLTEDRTLLHGSSELDVILFGLTAYGKGFPSSMIEEVLSAGESYHETNALNFHYVSTASDNFLAAAEKLWKTRPTMMNESAKGLLMKKKREKNEQVEYLPSSLNEGEEAALALAREEIESWGYGMSGLELVVTDNPGNLILGLAIFPNKVILAKAILCDEDKLRQTLIEEISHLRSGHQDETRAFQDFLLMEIVRVGYELSKARRALPRVTAEPDDEILF